MNKNIFLCILLNSFAIFCQTPSGLSNEGNTCFMNASLQCIYNIEPLTNFLLSPKNVNFHSSDVFNNNRSAIIPTITAQYKKLISKIKASPAKTVTTLPFCQRIWQTGNFIKYRQDDAMAFIETLINHIIDFDINQNNIQFYGFPYNRIAKSKIGDLFRFTTNELRNCSNCKNQSFKNSLETFLPVQISGSTLQSCLKAHFDIENIGSGEFKCSKCNTKSAFQKQIQLLECPQHLIIQLKRFAYDKNSKELSKLKDTIKFPVNGLDLKPYFHNSIEVNNSIYDLSSIVMHVGSINGGHYWAWVKDNNSDRWYDCNDDTVTLLSAKDIANLEQKGSSDAYILFYKNRGAAQQLKKKSLNEISLGNDFFKAGITTPILLDYLQNKSARFTDLINGILDNFTTSDQIIDSIKDYNNSRIEDIAKKYIADYEPGADIDLVISSLIKQGIVTKL